MKVAPLFERLRKLFRSCLSTTCQLAHEFHCAIHLRLIRKDGTVEEDASGNSTDRPVRPRAQPPIAIVLTCSLGPPAGMVRYFERALKTELTQPQIDLARRP